MAGPSSLRARLTLWYTILLGVPLIVFAVVSYKVVERALENRTDRFIGDALTAFSRELSAERRAALTPQQAMRNTISEVRFQDLRVAILDDSGRIAVMSAPSDQDDVMQQRPSSATATRMITSLRAHDLARPVALVLSTGEGTFRVLSRPLHFEGQRYALTGAYSMRDIDGVLSRMRALFYVAIPLLLVSAALGGFVLARRSLAPVASMARDAAAITVSNIHQRLNVSGGDELVQLARVVNGLLDRLEHSFEQQRRFVADASHELRTPTAVVRTEADVTLSREHRDEQEYRASVTVIQSAARRLTRLVDDLFLLARADSGHIALRLDTLYLDELVDETAQSLRSLASERGVQIAIGSMVEAPVHADADLLGRLLQNLLDNAIKHSPHGGVVQVGMQRGPANEYVVSVVDAGPGIPADLRDRVFERFFRVDSARSRSENTSTGGGGLGLPIARRIAELHNGRVAIVESRPGRTEITFSIPEPT